jgi:hypothetical protein
MARKTKQLLYQEIDDIIKPGTASSLITAVQLNALLDVIVESLASETITKTGGFSLTAGELDSLITAEGITPYAKYLVSGKLLIALPRSNGQYVAANGQKFELETIISVEEASKLFQLKISETAYANDAAAIAGNVQHLGLYPVAENNEFGLPADFVKMLRNP